MSLSVRKRAGGYFHYYGRVGGTSYSGNTGCKSKKEAQAYADDLDVKYIKESDLGRLMSTKRKELAEGRSVKLEDAWSSFVKSRRHRSGDRHVKEEQSRWADFVAYMNATYPDVIFMHEVLQRHAEGYSSYISKNGRFVKRVSVSGRELSPRTQNAFTQTCKMAFSELDQKAAMGGHNPFSTIDKLKIDTLPRKAFSPDELTLIGEKAEGWIKYLFMVGACTGLREGDICTFKWDEVDMVSGEIRRRTLKTGTEVNIPMMVPGLRAYLESLGHATAAIRSDYLMPDLAERYLSEGTRAGIGKDIAKFLENECGIETCEVVKGRSRRGKVKDVHSLRHTFCYMAAMAGIPIPVVQSIVGHMSPEMTKRYMDHADRDDRSRHMASIPNYLLGGNAVAMQGVDAVGHIVELIGLLDDDQRNRLSVLVSAVL